MGSVQAIGVVETFGLVFVLEAADAMCKAANVELIGYENTASGYIAVVVSGDVEACELAVKVGTETVQSMEGGNLYASVVVPSPHEDLKKILDKYAMDVVLPVK